jgi:hypothetical protein
MIDLDTEGVQDPGTSDAILESSTFEVRLYDDAQMQEEVPWYWIDCEPLQHPTLRNVFVTAWDDGHDAPSADLSHFRQHCIDLSHYLDGVVVIQLMKIPKAQGPRSTFTF